MCGIKSTTKIENSYNKGELFMPISQKKLDQLIQQCSFTKKENSSSCFIFYTSDYQNEEDENKLIIQIERKKNGKLIQIRTKELFHTRQSACQAAFTTLAILCHHIPGLSFSYSAEDHELCLHSSIFSPDVPPSAALIKIHVNIIVQTIDSYYSEIAYALENDALHHTFLPQALQEKRIEDFEQMLEELQNFVNEEEATNDNDDEPSDDIEWL